MFKPKKQWPAGQQYEVHFKKSLFAKQLPLAKDQSRFHTPKFSTEISSMRFYKDPTQTHIRNVISTFTFSHPVETQSFESRLSLSSLPDNSNNKNSAKHYGFNVTYSNNKRQAFVHSETVAIKKDESYLYLQLDKGVKTVFGASTSTEILNDKVIIPSTETFFRLNSAKTKIVHNKQKENQPEQILLIEFSDGVTPEALKIAINAVVLPIKRNANGYRSAWRNITEITPAVLARATLLPLRAIATDKTQPTLHSFRFNAPEGRQLYLEIKNNITSAGGFQLNNSTPQLLSAPNYPKEAKIAFEGALISSSSEKKISFVSRGIHALKIEIKQLLPREINHLVSQTHGDIKNPLFHNEWNFNEDNITRLYTKIQRLNVIHPSQAIYSSLDLEPYLKQANIQAGAFFITIYGWNPTTQQKVSAAQDQRLIIISDLGLLVKDNADQSHDLFVQSIQQGLPVADTTVEVLGKNGRAIITAVTDAEGHVSFPNLSDFHGSQSPVVYLVTKGHDHAFIPYQHPSRQINYSRFDVGGIQTRYQNRAGLDAYLFSDRGLYRPGDTVHLAAIVKQRDWHNLAALPVEIQIRDPRGTTVMRKKITLPASGFIDWPFKTEPLATIGTYSASLHLIKNRGEWSPTLGSLNFKVKEFQPDRLKISSKISGKKYLGWYQPNKLTSEVKLENLFGTPAQNRTVKASMQLVSADFSFKSLPDVTFTDPLLDPKKRRLKINTPLQTQTSDQQGRATFSLDLSAYESGSYRLEVNSEGFESGGGRSVQASSSVLVSPLTQLVGFKADGDLDFIHKNSTRSVQLIAINPDLKQIPLNSLRKNLLVRRYISTLVKQSDGTLKYQSRLKESQIKSEPFAIAKKGETLLLDSSEAGDYVIELVNERKQKLARIFYSVAGAGNLSRSLEKNAELQVKLDQKSYSAGQEIKIQISAPYAGAGLITIERDKVYAYKWFKTDTSSTVQSIQIPAQLEGNAYLNVAFIRSVDSKEIFTSPLSYSAIPFSIEREKREIQITLQSAEKIKPGEFLNINYATSKPAKIALFAIDEGILQVARYHTPNPLSHFLKKQALEVNTFQTVDLILPEYRLAMELAAAGGGSRSRKALGKNLNPFGRTTEKPIAFWSGILNASEQVKQHQFKIPEHFNGTLRVMAVAVSAEALGHTEQKVVVKGPFVITPNAPLMVTPGDKFEVTVGLANNLPASAENDTIQITLHASKHLSVIGAASQSLQIPANSEAKISFWLRAEQQLGSAQLKFSASQADNISNMSTTLSVRPATPYRNIITSGYHASGQAEIPITEHLLPNFSQQTATASHSPLLMVEGLSSYLKNFVHGCAEQRVSKVFPYLGLLKHPSYVVDQQQLKKDFTQLIITLRNRQTNSGAFRFWAGQSVTQGIDFPSVYISHFLTDAKELGYPVPQDLLSKSLDYLRTIARNSSNSIESARLRAYAIYLLSRNQILASNHLIDLYSELEKNHSKKWQDDITSTYMAASFQLLKNRPLQQKMLDGYDLGSEKKHLSSDFDSQLSQDAQYLYLLAKHFPDQFEQRVDAKALMTLIKPLNNGQYNTLSAAYSMLALGAYTRHFKNAANDETIKITAITAGKLHPLDTQTSPFAKAELPLNSDKVKINAGKNLFYLLKQSGYADNKNTKQISNGIEIQRDYYNQAGERINAATIGSEVEVRIRIRALNKNKIDNVAIIDLLPAGFEVVNNSFKKLGAHQHWNQHQQIHEDRLVIYDRINRELNEYRYHVKITTKGEFSVPSIDARSMYQRHLYARSAPAHFTVTD
ncbi:MAG: alpha-2-macroglobulin [Gammaproteobacteria bacterium]|nr:alpha-2-macroglobulin [Gammaproteobacteria bacterium]